MPIKQQRLESLDSASPLVTRSVAAALRGLSYSGYQFSRLQRWGLRFLGMFPSSVAKWLIPRVSAVSALDPDQLTGLKIETLVQERLQDYAHLPRSYPAITIGAALGGAGAHLALSLNGPFLPQAFVMTIKGGSRRGDVGEYFLRSDELAAKLVANNPGVIAIQHFDPVHDGWLTRYVNHIRLKLIQIPEVYKNFIRRRLSPNGFVCFLDCTARWLQYRISERRVFQVGGWGGINPIEYLEGSQRLADFRNAENYSSPNWTLPDHSLEWAPESEWGCIPDFVTSVAQFCHEEGFRFVHISYEQPHTYSHLALKCVEATIKKEGREPAGVLVEMFSQFDTTAILKAGLLPVWLVFNTKDSLEFLKDMRESFLPGKPVFFSPLSTFTQTPDLVPWDEWERALAGFDWRNVGARRSHYPADPLALISWTRDLRSWVEENANPIHAYLGPDELIRLAGSIGDNPML